MSKPQKILTIGLWILAVVAMVAVLVLRNLPTGRSSIAAEPAAILPVSTPTDQPPQVFYDVPNFTLVDQDGKPFGNAQLSGHPWVADFIYTTCATQCPLMSLKMQSLQAQLPDDVKLVSFSVDPQHDTPAVLADYAGRYRAQPGRWFFLTGQEKLVYQVISGMKIGLIPAQAGNPIQHDVHFILVDRWGRVRGAYDSDGPAQIDQLVSDAQHVDAERDAPAAAGAGR
jgi:protein SCO1/2